MPDHPATRILIVDDEVPQMRALCDTLGGKGYATTGVATPTEALAALRTQAFDLLLTDLMMPEMDGTALLRAALQLDPNLVGVVMTGQGTIDSAVEAMKSGALDYILKPFKLSAILPVLARAETVRRLRREKAVLAQRVRDRSAELEAANHDLEAFAQSVSHDLHAPVRAIKGFSQMLIEESEAALSDQGRHYLNRISEGAGQMERLIASLLNLARIGRQPLMREPVNTGRMVEEVVAELREQSPGRPLDARVGQMPACQADATLLRQVWFNLLSNAFKYTRKVPAAMVEAGCAQGPEENVYFVRDNGAGFDMRNSAELFNPFRRLHSSEDFEGSGVGLSTVQRIVVRHGGRIWAEAAVDQGATFFFTLPQEAPAS